MQLCPEFIAKNDTIWCEFGANYVTVWSEKMTGMYFKRNIDIELAAWKEAYGRKPLLL